MSHVYGLQDLTFSEANQQRIDAFLKTTPGGIAVFDADGTLWADDVGEAFFRWLVSERKLLNVDYAKDLWQHYETLLKIDHAQAYAWITQVMAGLREDDVNQWASAFFENHFVTRIYRAQKDLIKKLKQHGFVVWIVSASNIYVVRAGARHVGIEPDHVIGYQLAVSEKKLTSTLIEPTPYRAGKLEAIMQVIKKQPILIAGDSRGDKEMLESSQGLSIFIVHNKNSQKEMIDLGMQKNWLFQYFPLVDAWQPQ